MSGYVKIFAETKSKYIFIKDNTLLKTLRYKIYKSIWDKPNNSIKKGYDKESVCNKKYINSKIKSYESKINSNFHNNKHLKKALIVFAYYQYFFDFVFKWTITVIRRYLKMLMNLVNVTETQIMNKFS